MSKGRDRGTRRTAAQNHAQGEAQRGDLCRTARRTDPDEQRPEQQRAPGAFKS